MKLLFTAIITVVFLFVLAPNAYSAIIVIEDGYFHTTITHPDRVIRGSDFNISILTKNEGSIDRFNATMKIMLPEKVLKSDDKLEEFYGRVAGDSSYGKTITIRSFPNSTFGEHFINIDISHIYGHIEYFSSVAVPITIREEPKVVINTNIQDSIYTDAEFPFTINIESQGSDLHNVTIKIIPPESVTFRGQTQHTFSSLDRDTPISLRSELITASTEEVNYEHYIPFQITVNYVDDTDTQRSTSETISVLLRPKTFFEFGGDGGFWFGDFYVTQTVSVGTIIGIFGSLFGVLYKKRRNNR